MKKKLKRLALGAFLLWLAAGLVIAYYGTREELAPAEAAVVLGNEVLADGRPSARLAARLERGAQLYREGLCRVVIVSGGQGKSGFDEARVMADYLVARGLPVSAVVVDSSGVNTRGTARFTAAYLAGRPNRRIIAVSQYYHIPRCRLAFHQAGLSEVGSAYPRYLEWRDFYSLTREMPALARYWLQGLNF